jgi:hypothetical protein
LGYYLQRFIGIDEYGYSAGSAGTDLVGGNKRYRFYDACNRKPKLWINIGLSERWLSTGLSTVPYFM